jgi:hypothetical protein
MRHPADGTIRRLLDEPAGVADTDREHVRDCPVCLSTLATMKEDAALVAKTFEPIGTTDVDTAWLRLSNSIGTGQPAPRAPGRRRWRNALRSPLVAVVGVVAILSGASTAAATDWLQIFRAEEVAPVTAPRADLVRLPDLDEVGTLEVDSKVDVRPVADAAAAEKVSKLAVPRVDRLPRGVNGQPRYFAGAQASATFTFSVAKTAQTLGATPPTPPPGLDGSRFRFTAGPGVVSVWGLDRGVPAMIVGRAVAPAVYSTDVPFATARDYVLSLPNVPDSVKSQLRAFSGDGTTLPLFVQEEKMTTSTADVGGVRATVLASRDGVMAGVVWVSDGIVTAVAGPLSVDEVLSVARGLKAGR